MSSHFAFDVWDQGVPVLALGGSGTFNVWDQGVPVLVGGKAGGQSFIPASPISPVPVDPGALISLAAAFGAVPTKTLQGVKSFLLCQWANTMP